MDQARFEGLLREFQSKCVAQHALRDLAVVPGQATAPIVVLVHGIGGNARHWSDPAGVNPEETWLFDLNSEPPPGVQGILKSPPYVPGSVKGWSQLLSEHRITHINWSQARPDDALQFAVTELTSILTMLEQIVYGEYAAAGKVADPIPQLIILCHSRGGLVTRAALKQLGNAGVPHLRKVISLTTPHEGSYMPRIAQEYNERLQTAIDFSPLAQRLPFFVRGFFEQTIDRYVDSLANQVRTALLHSFGTLAQGPGFTELIPGSSTLTTLAQAEQPLSGVQYFGWGGSNPVFVNFYVSGLGQVFYLMAAVGGFLVERMAALPGIATTFGGLQELLQGDSSVALRSSRWPAAFGAHHQEIKVNHMQALVDPALQQAVLEVLRA